MQTSSQKPPGTDVNAPVTVDDTAIRDAMNTVLAESMRPICVGLALFYALISIWYVHELTTAAVAGPPITIALGSLTLHLASGAMMPLSTGIFSFGLLTAAVWFERNQLPASLAHPVAAGIGALVIVNCLLLIVSAADPRQTTNLMVAQIGFGCLLLSVGWFSLLSALSIGGWLWVVGDRRAEADWNHFGIALIEAMLFGALVLAVRLRAQRRLQRLRLEDEILKRHLQAANAAAKVAVKAKSEFLANMSHEIRTPMTAMLGMTELLQLTELDATQRDYADTVARSGDALVQIVNDILDFSKIEAGQLSLEEVRFDVQELVTDVRELLRVKAKQKDLELRTTVADDIPRHYLGDPTRIRQVLVNLIGNAIKFTHRGHVTLHVDAMPIEEGRHQVSFAVEDTGIGIAVEHQKRVFEAFTQADTSTTRRYGGTGLGLAISNQLAHLMGGELILKSTRDEGSTFTLSVPLHAEGRVRTIPPSAPEPGERSSFNGRVLLVEDNAENLALTVELLQHFGCSVDCAADGREALDKLRKDRFDLVFMDCHMPNLNGYDATREMRRREGDGTHTPVVALTASVLPEERQRCLDVGMDDYITKPFSRHDLRRALARWLV